MSKLNSLILLIKSLSKSEKKAIALHSQTEDKTIYFDLFTLIDKEKYPSKKKITQSFQKKHPHSFLAANVKYLFDLILQVLVNLNTKKNKEYELYNAYLKSKILRERDLHEDHLSLITQTKEKANEMGLYNLGLTLQREELSAAFDHLREPEDLYSKQKGINENLKIIRQISEQSFLYESLRFKIEMQKSTQTGTPYIYNDLLISEMSLVSGLKNEIFEISRLHQLFQANYFISIGSFKSALNSFSALNELYLSHQKFWNDPPLEYVMTLEGILESLNRMRLYEEMEPYKKQLSELAQNYPYTSFVLTIHAITFLYKVYPLIFLREYKQCLDWVGRYQELLFDKLFTFPPRQFLSLSACLSAIYLLNKEWGKAKRILSPIIQNNAFAGLKLFRSVQLLNLIIYYELRDLEYVEGVIRSVKRKNRIENKETQVERLMFRFLETDWKILSAGKAEKLKMKFENEIKHMKYSVDDLQLIKCFDFPEWIRSKLN